MAKQSDLGLSLVDLPCLLTEYGSAHRSWGSQVWGVLTHFIQNETCDDDFTVSGMPLCYHKGIPTSHHSVFMQGAIRGVQTQVFSSSNNSPVLF